MFQPILAKSLISLSRDLFNLGHLKEALKASKEAVTAYRKVAEFLPDAFLADLATSLNSLSRGLSSLGHARAALKASKEAVNIYRGLAQIFPNAFLADLAGSLNNLCNRLSKLGAPQDALKASNEAVTIYRDLAASRPGAFLPTLATSLASRTRALGTVGRHTEAALSARQGIVVVIPIVQELPEVFGNFARVLCDEYCEQCASADVERDEMLLERIAHALDSVGLPPEHHVAFEPVIKPIEQIIEVVTQVGGPDEAALTDLPAPLPEHLREMWSEMSA